MTTASIRNRADVAAPLRNEELVSKDGFIDDAARLPKSQLEYYGAGDDIVEIRLPQPLAEKLGLI
jgi:hypothetical protein